MEFNMLHTDLKSKVNMHKFRLIKMNMSKQKQTKTKIYKHNFSGIIGMLPSDPTGSLDDFFSRRCLSMGGI